MEHPSTVSHNQRSGKVRTILLIGCVTISIVLVWSVVFQPLPDDQLQDSGVRNEQNAQVAQGRPMKPQPLIRSTSRFLNTELTVKYVGSTTCADCHTDPHQTFSLTHHSRSLTRVHAADHPPDGIVDHPLSHRSYHVHRSAQDDEVWHTESVLHDDGQRTELASWPVQYQMGSGQVAFSYFAEDDGFLIESPVTWFAKHHRWDMSPGYDTADQASFGRIIRSGCLNCHAGRVESPDQNGFRHRITELAIGCERCHGPGERHVERHRDSSAVFTDIDWTIVNPVYLTRELSEAICAQCHLNGDVQATVRGTRPHEFRPGLPLHEYRLEFRDQQPETEMRVAGHVEQLHESRCYQKSSTLTCITCHETHENRPPAERLTQHRATCLSCHQQQPCLEPMARRAANADNCIACHMPSTSTEVTHVALTHHRIGLHNQQQNSPDSDVKTKKTFALVPLQSLDHLSAADRNCSQGLAQLALVRLSGKSSEQLPRLQQAAQLLRQAYDDGIRDPETLTALAGIARDAGQFHRGIALAKQALQSPDLSVEDRLVTLDVLAELHFRGGQLPLAADYLRQITRDHRSALHWFLLGQVENQNSKQDRSEVAHALRRAAELAPANTEYRLALAAVLEQAGETTEAEQQRQLARQLSTTSP